MLNNEAANFRHNKVAGEKREKARKRMSEISREKSWKGWECDNETEKGKTRQKRTSFTHETILIRPSFDLYFVPFLSYIFPFLFPKTFNFFILCLRTNKIQAPLTRISFALPSRVVFVYHTWFFNFFLVIKKQFRDDLLHEWYWNIDEMPSTKILPKISKINPRMSEVHHKIKWKFSFATVITFNKKKSGRKKWWGRKRSRYSTCHGALYVRDENITKQVTVSTRYDALCITKTYFFLVPPHFTS